MTSLRVYAASLVGSPPPSKLRVYAAALNAPAPTSRKLRIFAASVSGAIAVVLNNIRPQTDITPGQIVTFTATVAQGPLGGVTFNFVQISGPPVTDLTPSGASVSFTAPSAMPPDDPVVVIGVTASAGGATSPQVLASATLRYQTDWVLHGSTWVPAPDLSGL